MGYYFKRATLPWVYLVFMLVLSLSVHAISNVILKYVLMTATLLLYVSILAIISYKDGQEALKVRISNDIERKTIIETGEDRPLNLKTEYKTYKGFLIGLVVCIPLFVLLILHTAFISTVESGTTFFGTVTNVLYSIVFNLFRASNSELTVYTTYYTLLYVPIVCLSMGLAYVFGAKQVEKQQKHIKDIHNQIYGE